MRGGPSSETTVRPKAWQLASAVGVGVLSATLAMGGCGRTSPAPAPASGQSGSEPVPVKVEEPQAITTLRAEVHRRGLEFHIFCDKVEDDPDQRFFGGVVQPGTWGKIFIEEGGKPMWTVYGPTQEETARRLLVALRHPPNQLPEHKPVSKMKEGAYCPPDLVGN